MEIIHKELNTIRQLCQRYSVAELYVFGSVLKDSFSPTSDVDFLVRFSGVDLLEYFDNFMDFKEALERILSREVDLVEMHTIKNPILKRSIDRNKRLLYGRENSEVAI